ncbi:helix-turn-helix domain-containing protein [Paenibacillus hemerocallicola]|uniref:Helix-turn-helix domain-containing protein n=2 Tax=Paenibacillus hemerocallicola TaxID=1172614 RepID=A0A5C4T4R2_9BACL|nr:helix-turn-helix domain-containing protein [Paenibacillus hemerocallicola]
MYRMRTYLDYSIGPLPFRINSLLVSPSLLRLSGLRVFRVGYLPGRTGRRRDHVCQTWALAYIVGGRGFYQLRGFSAQKVPAGSLILIPPGQIYDYGPDAGQYWDEYYVRFDGPRVSEWMSSGYFEAGTVARVGIQHGWKFKFEAIAECLASGLPNKADRAALLLESLLYEITEALDGQSPKPGQLNERTATILDDISSRVFHRFDANALALSHHMAVSTLRALVKQQTGFSLGEYVNLVKITEAKRLLRGTDIPVNEIGSRLGFDDPAYFSRLFRKHTGVSATAFRKRL